MNELVWVLYTDGGETMLGVVNSFDRVTEWKKTHGRGYSYREFQINEIIED